MPRRSITVFADAMEEKLKRDDCHKKPWETIEPGALWMRAIDEMVELKNAIKEYHESRDEYTARNVRQEAADVANFAMMIYSTMHTELNGLVRGREPEPSAFTHGGDVMPSDRAIMKGGL